MDKDIKDILVTVYGVSIDYGEVADIIVRWEHVPLAEITPESIKQVLLTPGVNEYQIVQEVTLSMRTFIGVMHEVLDNDRNAVYAVRAQNEEQARNKLLAKFAEWHFSEEAEFTMVELPDAFSDLIHIWSSAR